MADYAKDQRKKWTKRIFPVQFLYLSKFYI